MFQRIYIHNYKCLQDFEWNLNDEKSLLLLGKNGTGKSSILSVLELLRDLALGKETDTIELPFFNNEQEMILKFDILIKGRLYHYEVMIQEVLFNLITYEKLEIDGEIIFNRDSKEEIIFNNKQIMISGFVSLLPLLVTKLSSIYDLLEWLKKMILIAPNPSIMSYHLEYLENKKYSVLDKNTKNLVTWLNDWLDREPMLYSHIDNILRKIIPDFQRVKFDVFSNHKYLQFFFGKDKEKIEISFANLSDGERIIFLFSIILALMSHDEEPIFVFWDEPENYISLALLQSLIQFMRSKAEFSQQSHQVFFSSHNSEVINAFSSSHIYYLYRNTHITPTRICNVAEKGIENIIDELKYGELS